MSAIKNQLMNAMDEGPEAVKELETTMAQAVAIKNQAQTPTVGLSWTPDQVELIKRTICKDATDDELKLFMYVCQRTGLDPFARQIYAVKRPNRKTGANDMTIQVAIDGFRATADRTGLYAGSDDAVLDHEKEPNRATVTVYKIVAGTRCAFSATARWDEYYPGDSQGFMWKKMPCVMLSKCAEALALRKAFPSQLSGLYTPEEMDQAESGRIGPSQPGENDGFKDTTWKFTFGKFKDKTLEQLYYDPAVGAKGLGSYVNYLETNADTTKKPLSQTAKDAIAHIDQFLGAMENKPTEDDLPF